MSEEADSASYQARLVEIFQSCDSAKKGYLSLLEFERLCRQLQIQHQRHRLYAGLGLSRSSGNTKVYFEDFKAALLSLLQEVGSETLTSGDQHPALASTEDHRDSTPKRDPVLPQKHVSLDDVDLHLDLPADMIADDVSDSSGPDQPHKAKSPGTPSPLKRAFLENHNEDTHAGKQRRSNPGEGETFEAEGQLWEAGEYGGRDSDSGLEQLHHVCSKLGVGAQGYLTQVELGQVCHYIGIDQMDDEELEGLFKKLDVDHDGYISFEEFVQGLAHHTVATPRGGFEMTPRRTPVRRPLSARKVRTPLPPSQQDRRSPAIYSSGDNVNLFSSLPSSETGFAKGDEIVDFWERMSVPHGAEILMNLGFNPHSKIPLKELSSVLSSEWTGQVVDTNILSHAMTATYHQELVCLKSGLEQTTQERDKLRLDLADALSRNALMAAEVDERHAQLEKSYNSRLQSLEQEQQEQLRQSQAQLEKEREARSSQKAVLRQNSEEIQELQQQVNSLKDRLAHAEDEASLAAKEVGQARDKVGDMELECAKLKRAMQEKPVPPDSPSRLAWEREKQATLEKTEWYADENKVLKDHNDELLAQLEDLQHRTPAGPRRGSVGSQGRSGSLSRIPVRSRAASVSSGETSEWDDDDLSTSMDLSLPGPQNVPAVDREEKGKVPLSEELKQQQRQRRGERREREVKEIEHGFRVEIAELEDRQDMERQQLLHTLEKEKKSVREEVAMEMSQQLAEQQKELQTAFALEKQDLLQQYESRINLTAIHHQEEVKSLQDRLKEGEKQQKAGAIQELATNLYSRSRVQELEKSKGELEKEKAELEQQLDAMEEHYEAEVENLRSNYDGDIAQLTASTDQIVQAALENVFEGGASGLQGALREDFQRLVHQHRHDEASATDITTAEKEDLIAAFERDKLGLVQHYEGQIMALQEELGSLRQDFETERSAFQQLQSGDLAQSIRQELQVSVLV